MASTRRITAAIGIAGALVLGLPTAASAVVYCVPNNSVDGSCQTPHATIQAALTAAQTSAAVADTVRIGAGSYSELGLSYNDNTVGNELTVIGAGPALTKLMMPSTVGNNTGLLVGGATGTSVQNLAMTVPMNADANGEIGIRLLYDTVGENLLVDGPAATNTTGIHHQSSGIVDDSTVNLPFTGMGNTALSFVSGPGGSVTDATLHADTGVRHSNNSAVTVERSVIQASLAGATVDLGTIVLLDSLIDLNDSAGATGAVAANFNNGASSPNSVAIASSTIVNGGTGSTGVRASADSDTTPPLDGADMVNDFESSTVSITNSVISDVTTSLKVEADQGEVATVTTDYSNYDTTTKVVTPDLAPGGGQGTANFTEMNQTNLAPGFVNPAGGDYHLLASSPLLDIGDPAAPMIETDIDGDPRGLDKDSSCTSPDPGRRDIGADEFAAPRFDCIAPDTTASGLAKLKLKKKKKTTTATYTLGSTEAGSKLECSLDGGAFAACSASHRVVLRKGTHTLSVRATDAAGNVDTSPATVTTRVVKKKPKKK